MARGSSSSASKLGTLLAEGRHFHIRIRDNKSFGEEWRDGWVWRYDKEMEADLQDPAPGLQVLHDDGLLRSYWVSANDDKQVDAAEEVDPERAERSMTCAQYQLGDRDALGKDEMQQRISSAPNMGGDTAGKELLRTGNVVSRRVQVWWPDSAQYYAGVVYKWDNKSTWSVGFDDGDDQSYDLHLTQWKLEKTQVIIEDATVALTVDHDLDSGRPEILQAYVNSEVPNNKLSLHVGKNCVVVHADAGAKDRRKHNYVFLYPKLLDAAAATAVVDKDGKLKVTVPISASQ